MRQGRTSDTSAHDYDFIVVGGKLLSASIVSISLLQLLEHLKGSYAVHCFLFSTPDRQRGRALLARWLTKMSATLYTEGNKIVAGD